MSRHHIFSVELKSERDYRHARKDIVNTIIYTYSEYEFVNGVPPNLPHSRDDIS